MHKYKNYIGCLGVYGTRASNFTVQNSDLILCLGTRLDTRITGGSPASFARNAKVIAVDIDNYELLIDVNLKGTLYCIDSLKEVMKNKDNTIAIVSSPIGYRGWPTSGAYGMTKAAQLNLSESLFFDFKKIGINIKVINPGFIDTEATRLNSFKMPFLKSAEFAAEKIYIGLVNLSLIHI